MGELWRNWSREVKGERIDQNTLFTCIKFPNNKKVIRAVHDLTPGSYKNHRKITMLPFQNYFRTYSKHMCFHRKVNSHDI